MEIEWVLEVAVVVAEVMDLMAMAVGTRKAVEVVLDVAVLVDVAVEEVAEIVV